MAVTLDIATTRNAITLEMGGGLPAQLASEVDALAGLLNTVLMTPERTREAIADGEFIVNAYGTAARSNTDRANDFITPLDIDKTVGTGLVSASAAINEALSKGPAVLLPDTRNWLITDPIEIGDGQHLYAQETGTALLGPPAGTTVLLQGNGRLSNIRLAKNPDTAAPTYHARHDTSVGLLDGMTFENCQFENGSFAVYTFAYNYKARGLKMLRCRAIDVENPLFFESMTDALIDGFTATGASGANILFKSGKRSRITNYDLTGGTTGITVLGGQSVTGNGAISLDIGRGVIRSPAEEYVSFDCNGASPTDCTMRERAVVSSFTSDANFYYVTLTAPAGSWSGSSGAFVGAYMCFVDGALAGGCYEIYSNSNSGQFAFLRGTASGEQAMRAAAFASLVGGETVVIGNPFLSCTVDGLSMQGASGADGYMNGLLAYGGVFGARFRNIHADFRRTLAADYARGITLSSVTGIDPTGSYVSGTTNGRLAPVKNCTVLQSGLDGCDMALEPTVYGGDSPLMLGNRTAFNTINGGQRICTDNEDISEFDSVTA